MSRRAELIIASLKALISGQGESQIGLWGESGSGKTHLLNASADFARRQKVSMQIYDAAQLLECEARVFDEFPQCQVLAIDNLDLLAGREDWEACCYQLVNRCYGGEFRFLFSLSAKPGDTDIGLNDLRSRLQWGLMLQLSSGSEAELGEMLQQRAQRLGIRLTPEVINYLLTHYARNPATQMAILRRLDTASLSHQRRITIPLIKQTMAENVD